MINSLSSRTTKQPNLLIIIQWSEPRAKRWDDTLGGKGERKIMKHMSNHVPAVNTSPQNTVYDWLTDWLTDWQTDKRMHSIFTSFAHRATWPEDTRPPSMPEEKCKLGRHELNVLRLIPHGKGTKKRRSMSCTRNGPQNLHLPSFQA